MKAEHEIEKEFCEIVDRLQQITTCNFTTVFYYGHTDEMNDKCKINIYMPTPHWYPYPGTIMEIYCTMVEDKQTGEDFHWVIQPVIFEAIHKFQLENIDKQVNIAIDLMENFPTMNVLLHDDTGFFNYNLNGSIPQSAYYHTIKVPFNEFLSYAEAIKNESKIL